MNSKECALEMQIGADTSYVITLSLTPMLDLLRLQYSVED